MYPGAVILSQRGSERVMPAEAEPRRTQHTGGYRLHGTPGPGGLLGYGRKYDALWAGGV